MMYGVDVELIGQAINYYRDVGYSPKTVPMIVGDKAIQSTIPFGKGFSTHNNDCSYVGSAEQSFIQMMMDDNLEQGFHYAITPCMREEPILDETHLSTFLKIELICVGRDCTSILVMDAFNFFRTHIDQRLIKELGIVKTADGFDIQLFGIEIGSYGHRTVDGVPYTYGTGLAEPRFTTAQQKCFTSLGISGKLSPRFERTSL